jgi:hypothetical protein
MTKVTTAWGSFDPAAMLADDAKEEHAGGHRIRRKACMSAAGKPPGEHHAGRDQPQEPHGARYEVHQAVPAHGAVVGQRSGRKTECWIGSEDSSPN